MHESDFLVIGGGIIGLNIARELKKRFHGAKVILIEKERDCGLHASSRNSGVLHAGFYYSADSLKGKFTRDGNKRLTEYCETKGLSINKCGKLVVARNSKDLPYLDELLLRGVKNGVELQVLDTREAEGIEPRVKTFERALFSPTTSSVDPVQVMNSIHGDARREGVKIYTGVKYIGKTSQGIMTSQGKYSAKFIVGAAGLYADKVAKDFGFSKNYRILPFKGLYLYSDEVPGSLRVHVYPVPDPRFPFLGVHFTVTSEGKTKIGPTAIPAFWREQYDSLQRFDTTEFADLAFRQLELLAFSNFDFKKLAIEEIRKYSRSHLVKLTKLMLKDVHLRDYSRWGKPGIRAQLVDLRTRKLEMDFVVEGDEESLHILNAVSPAFTCAFPIADHIVERIQQIRKF
tara:strand:+ start:1210 stop:2412 length:1203 start_codon:yes stop_codon:yes gene_type:complete